MTMINGLVVKSMKLSKLQPAEWNPRKISDAELEKLKRSLVSFGVLEPIIWNKRTQNIVGGHQRVKALLANGVKSTDVIVVDMDATQEKQANIALNKISGEWDNDLLTTVLQELLDGGADLALTGFDEDEWNALLPKQEGLTDPDAIPEVVEPVAKLGDIWQLGEHRLMCGDSTDAGSVALLMNGERCDMIFTDPPYAVNYGRDQNELQKKSGGKMSKTRKSSKIIGDNLSTQECADKIWGPAFENMYSNAQDDCSFYMTMCQGGDQMMMMMMMSKNWTIKHELIWVKSSAVFSMGRLDYDYRHEPILFGWKKKHNFYGDGEFKNSVWEINKPNNSNLHPTMKPIALIKNALMNSSKGGDLVMDLFLGSGSTLITCEQLNRKCYGMELDPHYCDVIIKRWEDFTGKQAVKLA